MAGAAATVFTTALALSLDGRFWPAAPRVPVVAASAEPLFAATVPPPAEAMAAAVSTLR